MVERTKFAKNMILESIDRSKRTVRDAYKELENRVDSYGFTFEDIANAATNYVIARRKHDEFCDQFKGEL